MESTTSEPADDSKAALLPTIRAPDDVSNATPQAPFPSETSAISHQTETVESTSSATSLNQQPVNVCAQQIGHGDSIAGILKQVSDSDNQDANTNAGSTEASKEPEEGLFSPFTWQSSLDSEPNEPRARTRNNLTNSYVSAKEYKPQKHGLCLISSLRSVPAFGFSTAVRPCCQPAAPKETTTTSTNMNILRKHFRASSAKSKTASSTTSSLASKKEARKEHFSETKVFMPGSLMDVKRGCATPAGKHYYCDADKIRQRNECGLQTQDFFRGRTTFGSGKMGFQVESDVEGPGPAGLPSVRKPKLFGGRFHETKNLMYFDKLIMSVQGLPGPADYQTLKPAKVPGGKFNVSNPKRFIDQVEAAARKIPGPADTTTNRPWGFSGKSRIPGGHTLPRGGRIMFEQVQLGYAKITGSGQQIIRDLAAEAFDATPGPGQYYNDNF